MKLKETVELMIIGGVTVVNPEIRKLFRPLFLSLIPGSLSDQLLRLFTEVGMIVWNEV